MAAALLAREFAKQVFKNRLKRAAAETAGATALAAGAAGVGEALVDKPKAKTEAKPVAKTETKPETKSKREAPVMGSSKNINVGTGRGTSTPEKGTGAYTPKAAAKPSTSKSDTSSTPTASGRSRENTSPGGGSSANIDTERYKPKDEPKMGSSENVDTDRIGKGGFEADEDYTPVPKNQPVKFEDETSTPFWNRFKKGGAVKSSASRRGDGCAVRGKTRGKML